MVFWPLFGILKFKSSEFPRAVPWTNLGLNPPPPPPRPRGRSNELQSLHIVPVSKLSNSSKGRITKSDPSSRGRQNFWETVWGDKKKWSTDL